MSRPAPKSHRVQERRTALSAAPTPPPAAVRTAARAARALSREVQRSSTGILVKTVFEHSSCCSVQHQTNYCTFPVQIHAVTASSGFTAVLQYSNECCSSVPLFLILYMSLGSDTCLLNFTMGLSLFLFVSNIHLIKGYLRCVNVKIKVFAPCAVNIFMQLPQYKSCI